MNSQQCWKAKFESALFSRVQSDEITVWLVLIYGKFIYSISIFQEYETSRREAQRYTWEQWKDFKAMMQKYNLANSSGVELIRDEFFEGQCRKIFSKIHVPKIDLAIVPKIATRITFKIAPQIFSKNCPKLSLKLSKIVHKSTTWQIRLGWT